MALKFSLRILFVAIAIFALAFGSFAYRRARSGPAGGSLAALQLLRVGDPIDEQETLGAQEQICEQLIRSLGGDHAILIPAEFLPLACGTHSRPEGLEFLTEKGKSGGPRKVTSVSIRHPDNPKLVPQEWREKTMREIVKLTSLRTVSISSDVFGDDEIGQLRQLPELAVLDLFDTPMTDISLRYVSEMRKLEELTVFAKSLSSSQLTDRGLEHLANLPTLTSLGLRGIAIRKDIFSPLHGLRKLNLTKCNVSPDAYAGLGKCLQLENFHLISDDGFSESNAMRLAALPNLVHVVIYAELSDGSLLALCAGRRIEELGLCYRNMLTEREFSALESLPLKILDLSCFGVDGRIFEHLARIKSLREVSVRLSGISDDELGSIAEMTGLERLSLRGASAKKVPILSGAQLAWLKSRLPKTEIFNSP